MCSYIVLSFTTCMLKSQVELNTIGIIVFPSYCGFAIYTRKKVKHESTWKIGLFKYYDFK